MPVSIEAEPTDKVGYLYNAVRKEVEDFFRTTLPISDFHGVISGATFTQEMYDECREINRLYAAEVSRIMQGAHLRFKTPEIAARFRRPRRPKGPGR